MVYILCTSLPGAEVEVVHDTEGDLEDDGGDGGEEVHGLATKVSNILGHQQGRY